MNVIHAAIHKHKATELFVQAHKNDKSYNNVHDHFQTTEALNLSLLITYAHPLPSLSLLQTAWLRPHVAP